MAIMVKPPKPLTPGELAALDAQYKPFPGFEQWPSGAPRPDLWERKVAELEEAKGLVDSSAIDRALSVAMRAAAFDTGAIEALYTTDRGLTMSVATQAATWQQQVSAHDVDALTYFEAQLRAYQLVLDAATRRYPPNEAWLRTLHEELTAPQDTYRVLTPLGWQEHDLPRGQYKTNSNHVQLPDSTRHAYAPVARTSEEIARLIGELHSPTFNKAHPSAQASYAHYALVSIHPFADGNGRVARALASAYLYRAASVPFMVFADERSTYLDALKLADEGDYDRFCHFAFEGAIAAISMVTDALLTASSPAPEDALRAFRALVAAQGGLTHHDLDLIANRLLSEFVQAVHDHLEDLDIPPGIHVQANLQSNLVPPDTVPNFRPVVPARQGASISLWSLEPTKADREARVFAYVSTNKDESETIRIEQWGTGIGITFGLREVHPETVVSAQHRLRTFTERFLGTELTALYAAAEKVYRGLGYR
jgi:Fic family protein